MGCLGEAGKLAGITDSAPTIHQAQVGQYDPLFGQGKDQRQAIFDYLNTNRAAIGQDSQNAVSALKDAAANPGYAAAQGYAQRVINGDYLHGSPELDDQISKMRAASTRQVGDANAGIRDRFSRNGMGFSTANQQAQNNATALGTAGADAAEAATRFQNYSNERGYQNSGVDTLNSAVSAPLNYLSQVSSARLAPQAQMANIVQGLSGGGQTMPIPQDVAQGSSYMGSLFGNVGKL